MMQEESTFEKTKGIPENGMKRLKKLLDQATNSVVVSKRA
jgi:hypothetical protein